MPSPWRRVRASERPTRALSANFGWTLAGNVIFAAGQWAILSLAAKLGPPEMLGQYAYALSVATPVAMLFHLNLRATLATDTKALKSFGDYVAVRFTTAAAAVGVTSVIAIAATPSWFLAAACVLASVSLGVDNISDLYYGLMQRNERMDQVARSMMMKSLVAVVAMAIVTLSSRNVLFTLAAIAGAKSAIFFFYDRLQVSATDQKPPTSRRQQLEILYTAAPLGVVLMLSALNANLPRYAIQNLLGIRELGGFSAAASFITIGGTIVNSFGQSTTARMARQFVVRNMTEFWSLTLKLLGIAGGLGAAGILAAVLLGRTVLSIVYRPEYGQYAGLLIALMFAGVVSYTGTALGYAVTSTRTFRSQTLLLGVVAAVSGAGSWLLIPSMGLYGGAVALVLSGVVHTVGQGLILLRLARSAEAGT